MNMDLSSMINKYQMISNDEVRNMIDQMYIKQHLIIESCQSCAEIEKYSCFQEGFSNPGSSRELDMFKFDNRHIIKAIKYFNKAYSNIKFSNEFIKAKRKQERGELNAVGAIDLFGNASIYSLNDELPPTGIVQEFRKPNGDFLKAVSELEKQFICKFKLTLDTDDDTGTEFPNNPGKLTISQSKGFQLGGLEIRININPEQIIILAPANKEIFGQFMTSMILHEIYHNICHMMEIRNKKLHAEIKSTMSKISSSSNMLSSKSIITSFIDNFMNMFNINKKDIDKKRTMNRLYVLSRIKDNVAAISQFENDVKENKDHTVKDKDLDEYIEILLKTKKYINIGKKSKIIASVCTVLIYGLGVSIGSATMIVASSVCMALMSLSMIIKKVVSLFTATPTVKEEYFCDLFAAMYQLPIHLTSFNRQVVLNKKYADKVKKIRIIEHDLDKSIKDVHPLNFDRELTSYTIAKQILISGQKIKPAIRKYLQYIVDLHEGIEDIDNPTDERQLTKLDPESAKDLKKTLNDFVMKTGVAVTESFVNDFCSGVIHYA